MKKAMMTLILLFASMTRAKAYCASCSNLSGVYERFQNKMRAGYVLNQQDCSSIQVIYFSGETRWSTTWTLDGVTRPESDNFAYASEISFSWSRKKVAYSRKVFWKKEKRTEFFKGAFRIDWAGRLVNEWKSYRENGEYDTQDRIDYWRAKGSMPTDGAK